jgi:hypothetical protein
MQSIPGFEENREGAKFLADFVTEKLGKSILSF